MSSRLLVDVREPTELSLKMLKEVVSYPYRKILMNKEAFCEFCVHASEIILICRSGRRSNFAKTILINYGFENVEVRTPKAVRKLLDDE